jgi:hypothetical protein
MKQHKVYNLLICLLFITRISAHGFDPDTLVKNGAGSWYPLEQVCQFAAKHKKQDLASYDVNKKYWVNSRVASSGKSETNCYLVLDLNGNARDIICTPTQEFYLALSNKWIPAYELRQGDVLLGQYDTLVSVTFIEFVKKKRAVCSIEVKNTHTFMVGRHAVLTHNMVLPVALLASAKIPFELSAIGSALGLSFGAPAIVGGLVVGGIAGIVWKKIIGGKVIDYKLSFNTHAIEKSFAKGCFIPDSNPKKLSTHTTPIEKPQKDAVIGCGIQSDNQINTDPTGFDIETWRKEDAIGCTLVADQYEKRVFSTQQKTGLQEEQKIRYNGPKARNWKEFEQDCPIGQQHGKKFKHMGKQNPKDGAPLRQLTEDIPGTEMFKKNNIFALDRSHEGDHFEVWDKKGNWIGVANLDGSENKAKTNLGNKDKEKRNIKKIL